MLYDSETIRRIAETLKTHNFQGPLVCDPVCVSTSGYSLLKSDALRTLIDVLFPLSTLITPNKAEAEAILTLVSPLSNYIDSIGTMVQATRDLTKYGPKAALVKGGHFSPLLKEVIRFQEEHQDAKLIQDFIPGENMEILQRNSSDFPTENDQVALDVLHISETSSTILFLRPRIESKSTHGTGCTLSSAIACYLAHNYDIIEAVRMAGFFTHQGIAQAFPLGKGNGPLNHLHSSISSPIAKRTPTNPFPLIQYLIQRSKSIWKAYVEHPFVVELMSGTLPLFKFKHFMIQDYHYLKYYARAYAFLAAKSASFATIRTATDTILGVLQEVETTHLVYCAQLGITEQALVSTLESPTTTAYGAFIMDTGLQGDSSNLLMALLACLLGYGEVGLWIKKKMPRSLTFENHPYRKWIEDYSGDHYQSAVSVGLEAIEIMATNDPPSDRRLAEWEAIWKRCTMLEKAFWDDAINVPEGFKE